jgi:hypothetical protein
MWIQLGGVYVAGLAVTAMTLFRTRMFQKDLLMNTGSILLWPLYWILYGIALIKDRQ